MNLKAYLFDEDRGVSPVIGVILMVAITVILAAVIATFVMNMGPNETTMPQASFDWSNTSSDVTVTHDGGEAVDRSNLELTVEDTTGSTNSATWSSGELTSTDSISVSVPGSDPPASAELVWTNPESDETQILADWEA